MNGLQGLKIYRASAGSGKTYTLVGEYLKMLFERPLSYKNILAVTFTNKATAEMKERILKELANLAQGKESGYIEYLKESGDERFLRKKSAQILKLILHDYSRFSVMTIDSFFQKVIRSFAREIRLNASFRTEIDSRQALEEAIDLLFLDIDNNPLLMSWMVQFLEENMEEGKSWDFKKELIKFGKEADKEAFKIHGDELLEALAEKEQLSHYVGELKSLIQKAEEQLKKMGQDGIELLSASGLTSDQLKGGRNSFANHFNKLIKGNFETPTKTVLEACDNLENWYKKSDSPQLIARIEGLYHTGFNDLLKNSVRLLYQETTGINSAKAILKNIYPFGLLGNIALKIREVLREKNTVLLSDSGTMIGKIIEGNDTPFIYEKIGLIYRHFMLDEFQDTSRQQWANFRPLVENALASGNTSLVVGDVKQSIYRWRNGDWKLLASQLASDLGHLSIETCTLNTNYRSRKEVVDFNNTVFCGASNYLNTWFENEILEKNFTGLNGVISNAYADHYQCCSQTTSQEGYVKLTFVDGNGERSKNEFREKSLVLLVEQLEETQKNGIKAEEITILVRENSEAVKVANALWERKKTSPQPGCCYDVITSDTLKVGQSPVVRFVVNFFRFFARKEPKLVRAEILYGYYRILQPMMSSEAPEQLIGLHDLFDSEASLPQIFEEWLDEDPTSGFIAGLKSMPLFEMAVAIANHFHLGFIAGEKQYLQAFLDMVLEYGREDFGGISGFLTWWEDTGSSKTLNLPNIRNYIRISSIHQSKGLEYHTVFIPFCNWEIALNSHKLPYLWSMPDKEPFNMLKMVLLKCDSSLKNSIFSEDYYREMLLSIMDNLNLLYVALTRAINNLFVILPYKKDNKQVASVAELMQYLIEKPSYFDEIDRVKYLDFTRYWDPVNLVFEYGRLGMETSSGDPILLPPKAEPMFLNSGVNRMEIRIHSKDYFLLSGDLQKERINKGTVMHKLFEKIETRKDLAPAIHQMVCSGMLTRNEGDEIFSGLDLMLQREPFRDWFSDRWKVLNERDILRPGESKHRPDRVMIQGNQVVVIDYKTGEQGDKDLRQMKGYLSDLRRMGFVECAGFIWYLQSEEIVSVG